jgi:hypothetical protein
MPHPERQNGPGGNPNRSKIIPPEGSIDSDDTPLALPPQLEARLSRLEQVVAGWCPVACGIARCTFCPYKAVQA